MEQCGGGLELLVPAFHLQRAYDELRQFEANNRGWPPAPLPHRIMKENALATISVLILLATFHNITQIDATTAGMPLPDWAAIGGARSANILAGEWWRAVTALTLHADWAHLSSNLLIGGVFIVLLCRELGSGLAWSLLLGAGTLGNLINAALQPSQHNSLGASTAVFGAVGILAALSTVHYRHNLRRRWLLPMAAAVSLLALLGSEGKNTDLGAHLFGFVYGGFLGVLSEYLVGRYGRPGRWLNALLALASCAVVLTAWLFALSS
jgi:membrane associated rhomboid family serine protease